MMHGDLLDGHRPKRLVCSQGRWRLEVMSLVAVADSVFQPRCHHIDGTDAILGFLSKSEHGQPLLTQAYELLRSAGTEERRSFEAVEGEWVPTAFAPSYTKDLARRARKTAQGSISTVLAELRAELMMLRASHDRLKQRVRKLEARRIERRGPSIVLAGEPDQTPNVQSLQPPAGEMKALPVSHEGQEEPAVGLQVEARSLPES